MSFWGFFHPESRLSRTLARISDALWGSVLTAVCALPLLTAGSAICALYTANFRRSAAQEDSTTRDFLRDFRHNLKNGCVFTLLWAAFLALCVLWGAFLRRTQLTALRIPVLALALFCMELLLFAFPVSAILQPRPLLALRICLFLALKAPWYALFKLACLAGTALLAFVLPVGMRYWLLPVLLMGGSYWMNALFCALFVRVVKRHLPAAKTRLEAENEEAHR